MTDSYDYDLFVIGAGSGGTRASRVAAAYGAKVAVAEEYRVGGTCVIRGCVPKKLLVYGAHFAEDLADARRFGWNVPECAFDWKVLTANVFEEVDRINAAYTSTLTNNHVDIINDRAVITGPHSLRLGDGRAVTAARILVATGATPSVPDVPGAELGITSNEAFHLDAVPKRMVIAGAGYIANEFAGVFHQFGAHVTLVNRSDVILRGYDEQIRDRLLQIMTMKGMQFRFHAALRGIERQADGSLLMSIHGQDPIETDCVMFATGRDPYTKGLGLESAGITVDAKGAIPVNEQGQTTCESIFAIGDVTNRVQLTPVAIREGQAFADTFYGGVPRSVDYDNIPAAVFSHPPIAAVGLTEGQAKNKYGSVKIYTSDFRPMKNVLAGRNERALYKMVCDSTTGRILGLHMIGPDAPEILQAAAVAVKAGLTKQAFDDTVALHPSMAEELVLLR